MTDIPENINPIEEHSPINSVDSEKKSSNKIIFIVVIALGLLTASYFLFFNKKSNTTEMLTLEQAQHQSDSLYTELKSQLARYKQENEDLYSQITSKESELETQYSKIKRLIDQAQRDKSVQKEIESKLKGLSLELDNMRQYVESQTLDLEELRKENLRLKKEKENLDIQYAAELAERERLEREGHDLQDANEELNKKLNTASVLFASNVSAAGLFIKNNGERKGINIAKKTELVQVCFDIVKNEVCPTGVNRFQLRIISPSGSVVYDDNRGSGKMKLFNSSEEVSYTTSKIFDYNTSVKNMCIEWAAYPTTPFTAGTYRIEIYNKGREVGRYDFVTK